MTKKDYNLDILRIISMVLVIVIHVANYYCRAFYDINAFSYFGAVVFNSVARVSVPIFFMISGALLLNKDYDVKKNKKRICKNIITLIIFTIVYLLWDYLYMNKTNINIIGLITSPERKMLWFMYAIIALYISLPFIKAMVNGMDEYLDKLFVKLWLLLCGVVYLLKSCLSLDLDYLVPIVGGTYYLGYFVVGYLIYKYQDNLKMKIKPMIWIIIFALSSLITIFLTFVISLYKQTYFSSLLAYRSLFIMLSSIAVFALVYFNIKAKESKSISFLAKHSFGVYLVHGFLLNVLMNLLPYKDINSLIGVPICVIILLVGSLIIVMILKKIPVIKDYI